MAVLVNKGFWVRRVISLVSGEGLEDEGRPNATLKGLVHVFDM